MNLNSRKLLRRDWFWTIILFYLPLFLSIGLIAFTEIYPSVDGAAHLYNSHIIKELLINPNTPYITYFEINRIIVPNWLDHILMAVFMMVLSPIWAQKVFLILMVLSQAILFRAIILRIQPENKYLSCLVFPFIFGFFFHEGFYNQQLSFVILYFFIFWIIDNIPFQINPRKFYVGIFIFSILFWFSSIVTFALFILILGITLLLQHLKSNYNFVHLLKSHFIVILVFLPTLILSFLFITQIHMVTDEKPILLMDKLILFIRMDPLIVFDTKGESIFTLSIVFIITALLLLGKKAGLSSNPILMGLVYTGFILLLAFILFPNEAGAGMLSFRFAMSFYLIILILAVFLSYIRYIVIVTSMLVVGLFLGLTLKRYNGRIKSYSAISVNFLEVGKKIPSGSTIWPVPVNEDWFVRHSNNFLGIPNSGIVYENYETYYPWFPVVFKQSKKESNNIYNELRIKNQLANLDSIPADYLVLYGLNENSDVIIKNLPGSAKLTYETKDSSMKLYKLIRD